MFYKNKTTPSRQPEACLPKWSPHICACPGLKVLVPLPYPSQTRTPSSVVPTGRNGAVPSFPQEAIEDILQSVSLLVTLGQPELPAGPRVGPG